MYNSVLFGTLLFLGFGCKFVDCTVWLDDLAGYVTESPPGFKLVNVLTRLDKNENLKNPLSEELLMKLMQNIPTMRVNFEKDFKLPVNLVPNDEFGKKTSIDTSATLFLILIESDNSLPISMTKRFVDAVKEMAERQYDPKYLVVSFVRKPSEHPKELLAYSWRKKMLDLTIVELVEPKVARTSILMERLVAIPIIHQLNPFRKEYTAEKWTSDLGKLFPNKLKNMQKYPIIAWDPRYYDERLRNRDPSILLTEILIQRLNGSITVFNAMNETTAANMKKIELISPVSAFDEYRREFNDSEATTWILILGLRFLVPILQKSETSFATDFFVAALLSIGVILIIWIFARFFGFKSYPWRPFNIGRVFFGISISRQPRANAERIMFTCLLAIFAIYSSVIYGAITVISVEKTTQVEFNTLKDLADSDLEFHGNRENLERASAAFSDYAKISQDRFVEENGVICIRKLVTNKKISCLVEESSAIAIMLMFGRGRIIPMKFAEPRLVTQSYGFRVRASPYRSTVDKFILRFHSVGLIDKLFYAEIKEREAIYKEMVRKQSDQTDVLSEQLIAVSIVGYGLSIVVFFAEIIYHRISQYRKSKIRPLPPLFPWTE